MTIRPQGASAVSNVKVRTVAEDRKLARHGVHWAPAEPTWRLFQDNQSIWDAVLEQCAAAKHSIRLEQYIFGTRGVGRELLDLLATKAAQGVAVRVLADGLGSRGLPRSEGGKAVLRNGGHIAMFNGPRDLLRSPVRRVHRLHRKTVICDEQMVMVGGSCYEDRMSNWRDTMILIGGPLPSAVTAEFDRASRMAHDRRTDRLLPAASDSQGTWTYALSGPNIEVQPDLRQAIPERIAQARSSVLLTTPYLVPNRRLRGALVAAAGQGAVVRILMPARSDHRFLDVIGQRFARSLIRQGIEVRGYVPGMIHAKVALVDGAWSSVSSFNLDVFSGNLNLESGVFSSSAPLHDALKRQWDIDWASSKSF